MSHDTYPGRQDVQSTEEGVVPGSEYEKDPTAFQIPTQEVPTREGGYTRLPLETPTEAEAKDKEKKKYGARIAIGAAVLAGITALGTAIGLSHSESSSASGPIVTSSAEATPTASTTEAIQTNPNAEVDPQTIEMKIGDAHCNGIDSCAEIFSVAASDHPDYKDGLTHMITDTIQKYVDPNNGPTIHNEKAEDAFNEAFAKSLALPGKESNVDIIADAKTEREENQKYGWTSQYTVTNTDFSHLGDLKSGLGSTVIITRSKLKDGEVLPWSVKTYNVTYGILRAPDADKYELSLWRAVDITNK